MAILAACLPTLRPLAMRVIPRFMAGSSNQPPSSTSGYVRHRGNRRGGGSDPNRERTGRGEGNGNGYSAWVSTKWTQRSMDESMDEEMVGGGGGGVGGGKDSTEALHEQVEDANGRSGEGEFGMQSLASPSPSPLQERRERRITVEREFMVKSGVAV
ncbi:hypothetical protein EG329_004883 [Mollisiaceae sp. DMI_Dod_QoI]|nr:hypothetical protein EG329_004883 [Helotiales sp. DMI_Dod_QoI]